MNLKTKFISIIIIGLLLTGCSINKNNDSVADKATQQKTMTKVQNDVNEIMNKNYEYVIQNMGTPYCTTYYINIDDLDNKQINSLEDIRSVSDSRLVYPKYSVNDELGNSALYIELKDNEVIEVQTYEFSKYDIKSEESKYNIDLIADMYDENYSIQLNTIDTKDFDKYIGLEVESLNDIVNTDLSSFEVYDKYRENMIMGFFLDDKNEDLNNILIIYGYKDIIKDIKILDDSQTIELIKSKLIR